MKTLCLSKENIIIFLVIQPMTDIMITFLTVKDIFLYMYYEYYLIQLSKRLIVAFCFNFGQKIQI